MFSSNIFAFLCIIYVPVAVELDANSDVKIYSKSSNQCLQSKERTYLGYSAVNQSILEVPNKSISFGEHLRGLENVSVLFTSL